MNTRNWQWLVVLLFATLYGRFASAEPTAPNVCGDATVPPADLYKTLEQLASHDATQTLKVNQFLPAGQAARFVVLRPYDKDASYRVFIQRDPQHETPGGSGTSALLTGSSIVAQQIPANDPLLKKNPPVPGTTTVVSVEVSADLADLWKPAVAYIFACKGGAEQFVATESAPLSPSNLSLEIAIAFVVVGYILTAIAVGIVDKKQKGGNLSLFGWVRYLDPVVLTAGADGKGSASKLQILFFSCVVVGLLACVILRTGVLCNLSGTILMLMGISAVGAAASKATDTSKSRLNSENWAWLIEKGWLPPNGLAAINTARWRDVVTTNGEFDVYRFQMLLFSVLVGGALLISPWQDLASFSIPDNLLGVLGLSQVVYVGGKLVAPPSFADLDASLTELRKREAAFRNAAIANPDPALAAPAGPLQLPTTLPEAIRRAGQLTYISYLVQARIASRLFESVMDRTVASPDLEPEFA